MRDMQSPAAIPEVNRQKLESFCREMKFNKTPGIDGIPNIVLKAAIVSNIELFRQVFDGCVQERMFPRIWKRQRLVLIPKQYAVCIRIPSTLVSTDAEGKVNLQAHIQHRRMDQKK